MDQLTASIVFITFLFVLLGSGVWVGLSLIGVAYVGIELIAIEVRAVVASVETWLKYAEAVGLTVDPSAA